MFSLFKTSSDSYGELDDRDIDREINSIGSIRTTPLIRGFTRVTDQQLDAEKQALEQRKQEQKRFEKLLDIRRQWEEQDTAATVALFKYLSDVYTNLTQKRLAPSALKIVQEQSRLATAKADLKLDETRSNVDFQIKQLRTGRDQMADKYGWGDKP